MKDFRRLAHAVWECKYHVVWCPKYRRNKLYGRLRQQFVQTMHDLCRQKGIELLEGHACPDNVNICLNIPPKHSVSSIVGFLKGKSAIRLNKEFSKAKSTGKHFWIRGYFVSTVGLNEKAVREYIKHQESTDKKQLNLPELD